MQKVIVIAGPTGVGKTALSIKLAKALQGEVISGDSMQVYREMSIGTAKITKDEMQDVKHHLVDCIAYTDEYNVKIFQEKARAIMKELESNHRIPIICGGTGLYIKSLLYDYEFIEQEKDTAFDSFLKTLSHSQLYAILRHVDIEASKKIHPNNIQRIMRAISMAHEGTKKSDVISKQQHTMLYDVFYIGLTCGRELLYDRIHQRVDKMMEDGLLEEIKSLMNMGADFSFQSMQSIGYKEWESYFNGEEDVASCVETIKKNSRNFAKRQYTWFNNQMPMHWYDIETPNIDNQLLLEIEEWLHS